MPTTMMLLLFSQGLASLAHSSILQIDFGSVAAAASIFSSIAIILGAVFVVFEMKQNEQLLKASIKQADSAAEQARLANEQLKQNYNFANMDLIMRIYEFADSQEFESSWLTVLNSDVPSFEEIEKLSREKQLAFHQVASLFESIGLLVERGFVHPEIVDDMFATQLAWNKTKEFVNGMRKKYSSEDYYFFFERLYLKLSSLNEQQQQQLRELATSEEEEGTSAKKKKK